IGIVEEPKTATDHGMRHGLVSETKARREIFEVAPDTDAAFDPVYPGNQHRGSLGVKVRPAIGHFRVGAVVIPAEAKVQRELPADTEVVGDVDAAFNTARSDPGQREVLLDQ